MLRALILIGIGICVVHCSLTHCSLFTAYCIHCSLRFQAKYFNGSRIDSELRVTGYVRTGNGSRTVVNGRILARKMENRCVRNDLKEKMISYTYHKIYRKSSYYLVPVVLGLRTLRNIIFLWSIQNTPSNYTNSKHGSCYPKGCRWHAVGHRI